MHKTNKALAKRIKVTGTGKLFRRIPGQNHFNAKNSGGVGRKKRHAEEFSGIPFKKMMRRMPSA
ncbi:50S ribosomal protein L35 [Candidatus Azambacteria bacterium]|nr:50S ribosomal protein L35 [Candidatus Azambacteria bacterium]MBI3685432.1 50S ribosomal protein L35 [Candidatus Azambacteria bacterium]